MNEEFRKYYEEVFSCVVGMENDLRAMMDEGNRKDVQSINCFYHHFLSNLAWINNQHKLMRKYFPH